MKKGLLLPVLGVVVLFIAACSPPPVLRNDDYLRDTSLVTGIPCEAPCWQDIVPGETPWNEVQDFLTQDEDYTNIESARDDETGEEAVVFNYTDGPQCCRIYSRTGDVVDMIWLLLAPNMRLGDVLERYGDPTWLSAEDVTADQTFVALVFPDVPMVLYAFGAGIETGELTAASEVIGAVYMTAAEMETVLEISNLHAWDGYGSLSEMVAGDFDLTPESTAEATADTE